jgi:hypothetical protein
MFRLPNEGPKYRGTEEHPLLLANDKAEEWILLLGAFYPK